MKNLNNLFKRMIAFILIAASVCFHANATSNCCNYYVFTDGPNEHSQDACALQNVGTWYDAIYVCINSGGCYKVKVSAKETCKSDPASNSKEQCTEYFIKKPTFIYQGLCVGVDVENGDDCACMIPNTPHHQVDEDSSITDTVTGGCAF